MLLSGRTDPEKPVSSRNSRRAASSFVSPVSINPVNEDIHTCKPPGYSMQYLSTGGRYTFSTIMDLVCRFADTAIGRILIPTDEHSPQTATVENLLVVVSLSDAFDNFIQLGRIPESCSVPASWTAPGERTS